MWNEFDGTFFCDTTNTNDTSTMMCPGVGFVSMNWLVIHASMRTHTHAHAHMRTHTHRGIYVIRYTSQI